MTMRMGEPNLHRTDCFQSHSNKPVIFFIYFFYFLFFVALPLEISLEMWHHFFVSSRSVDSFLDTSGLVAAESDTSRHCNVGKSHIDCFSISDKYFIISLLLFITSLQEIAFSSLASVGWIRDIDFFRLLTFIHRNFSHLNVRCLWADFFQVLPLLIFPCLTVQNISDHATE